MFGDPKECREHARNCLQLAEASAHAEITRTFVDLAHSWTRLALDLESGPTPATDALCEPQGRYEGRSNPEIPRNILETKGSERRGWNSNPIRIQRSPER